MGISALERNVLKAQARVSEDGAAWTVSKHDRDSRLDSAVAAETQCC